MQMRAESIVPSFRHLLLNSHSFKFSYIFKFNIFTIHLFARVNALNIRHWIYCISFVIMTRVYQLNPFSIAPYKWWHRKYFIYASKCLARLNCTVCECNIFLKVIFCLFMLCRAWTARPSSCAWCTFLCI